MVMDAIVSAYLCEGNRREAEQWLVWILPINLVAFLDIQCAVRLRRSFFREGFVGAVFIHFEGFCHEIMVRIDSA